MFERSVTSRVIVEQLRNLKAKGAFSKLEGSVSVSSDVARALGVAEATVASALRFGAWSFGVGDIVLHSGASACLVRACANATGSFFLLVEELVRTSIGEGHSNWRLRPGLRSLKLGELAVSLPHCWTQERPGMFLVLHG